MCFQRIGERPLHAEVDDMLPEFGARDVPGLAGAMANGRIVLPDPAFVDRIARELHGRAASGLLFRPSPARGDTTPGPLDPDDEIPW